MYTQYVVSSLELLLWSPFGWFSMEKRGTVGRQKILLLALRKHPASPKGAASAQRFAYKRRAHRSANNISFIFYVTLIVLALSHLHRFTYCYRTRLYIG
jgi:hypothetical protein